LAKYKNINFQTAIIAHFAEISSTSFRGEDLNKVADHLYALIYPYLDPEIDRKLWEDNVQTADEYEYMMNKIRICMIVLYRMGMLPNVNYENRVFEEQIQARRSHIDDMAKQVAEEIYFKQILLIHVQSMTYMYNKGMDFNLEMHADLLWMYLTPYITHEDSENWDANHELHASNPMKYDKYYFIERKKRICMVVMDRAGFLWSRSVVDADETGLDDGRFLEDVGSPRPNTPAKIVDRGEDVYTEDSDDVDYDYFEYSDSDSQELE